MTHEKDRTAPMCVITYSGNENVAKQYDTKDFHYIHLKQKIPRVVNWIIRLLINKMKNWFDIG